MEEKMADKIWWKCNGCGYLLQQDVRKGIPKPCPSCNQDCTFTNVTCYKPECGGPQSGNYDPTLM
jgi:rubrerythrin